MSRRTLVRASADLAWWDDGGGAGAPLVLLHAGVADSRMWQGCVDAFAPERRVIRYDRRGFGETHVREPRAYAQVDDLLAVLDAANVERAVLVGCSQGGRIALDAALEQPQRVAALVLVAPAVSGAPEPSQPAPEIQALFDAYEAVEAAGDLEALNEFEARVWLDGPLAARGRVGGDARRLFLEMNGRALRAGNAGPPVDPPSAWDRLEQVAVPTLVLWGTLDFPHLATRCESLLTRIPGVQGGAIDGSAHLPSLDAPQALEVRLRSFLAALAAGADS
ncbi:alpha/beta fold hydrolase [Caldimonas sp. KR1-144]|uniref:alpha/beta fold hydrolase n=1 Tax=Caldimonas sp. KR1-144 TaxID=3400911 RepID=UPI003C10F087